MCPLWIPPLRERRDEIGILFEFFVKQVGALVNKKAVVISTELQDFINHHYDFPGNIRELKNMAQYIAYIAGETPVTLADLPERYQIYNANTLQTQSDSSWEQEKKLTYVRNDAEKEYLIQLLEKHRGNIKKICQEMALSRSRVYQLLHKFQLQAGDYR
jgi:DNA-binding NtrC family response regulator